MSLMRPCAAAAATVAGLHILAGLAVAQPTNTTLPGGWSWAPLPAQNGTYDTGLVGTPRGGFNTQTSPPFEDTSFGVMNEAGTPWFTGSDLSAQQYVQRQLFGNQGTAGNTGRFLNTGYQGTAAGSNFPRTAAERRNVGLNHWGNTRPDAGGVASFGQVVYVPISATLSIGTGYGADEMLLRIIGGTAGQRTQFFVDGTLTANAATTAFGGLSNNSSIRVNAIVQANNAGTGSYNTAWGYGATNNPDVTVNRSGAIDAVFVNGNFVQDPGQGIPANSVGYGFTQNFNVLSSLVQTGGTFNVTWDATADINNLVRDGNGNADARAQMGPGLEGNARLVVQWAAFQAVPTPGAAGLLALGALAATRRRR